MSPEESQGGREDASAGQGPAPSGPAGSAEGPDDTRGADRAEGPGRAHAADDGEAPGRTQVAGDVPVADAQDAQDAHDAEDPGAARTAQPGGGSPDAADAAGTAGRDGPVRRGRFGRRAGRRRRDRADDLSDTQPLAPVAAGDATSDPDAPAAPDATDVPPADPDVPQADPDAVVLARGLGMRSGGAWVYRHVDLTARAGEVVEVRGAGGTGRSMLLLSLTGRARPSVGTLRVLGHDLPRGTRQVRHRSAVARVDRVMVPEENHTVATAFRERARWERVRPRGSDALGYRVDEVRDLTGLTAAGDERVSGLAAVQQTLLAVALAALARPELLVLDDLDVGLPDEEQALVWAALARVAAADACTVLAVTAAGDPRTPLTPLPAVPLDRTVLELRPTHVEEP